MSQDTDTPQLQENNVQQTKNKETLFENKYIQNGGENLNM